MQRNWIGRSEGAEVEFQIDGKDTRITVFTTRPDTLFGATYMVLSPEHKLVESITSAAQKQAVQAYKAEVSKKSDLERTELAKEKTGVFTGAYAINPVNNERIPIWIADYVLASYGTGAIMAVPAHDERDLEFAKKFQLPVRLVVQAPDGKDSTGFVDDGVSINSGFLTGLPTPEAKKTVVAWLESKGLGRKTINYKLRDWLFSRQRYWGEPFPILWKKDASGAMYHEALPESLLPLLPPELTDFKPTSSGEPPLTRAHDWVNLPDGSVRETNTMPQWAGSCWYYLRYLDASNTGAFCGADAERYWMASGGKTAPGVDLYVGGIEHAVLHLLYARFWHKVLFDLGCVSTPEPFHKLVNQGLILGELEYTKFVDGEGKVISADKLDIAVASGNVSAHLKGQAEANAVITAVKIKDPEADVEKRGSDYFLKGTAIKIDARSFKMSKSRGNVVNPDDVLREFGADAFRLYEMFMGPLEMVKPWSTKGVEGVYRFLGRVWRLFIDEASETEFEQTQTAQGADTIESLDRLKLSPSIRDAAPTPAQLKALHTAIKKITEDLDGFRFNTAISALMVFVNDAIAWEVKPTVVLREFLTLLQPFAPHIAEELYARLPGHDAAETSLAYRAWPKFDPALLVEQTLEIPVQINGKLRDRITVSAAATQAELEAAALACDKIKPFLQDKSIKKVIVVPRKLVNIVAT
jgi:leucyl-tRNA synthetase